MRSFRIYRIGDIPSIRYKDDYNHLVNDLDFRKLNEGDVIYTHTFYAKQLFDILDVIGKPVYIITHNADEQLIGFLLIV